MVPQVPLFFGSLTPKGTIPKTSPLIIHALRANLMLYVGCSRKTKTPTPKTPKIPLFRSLPPRKNPEFLTIGIS